MQGCPQRAWEVLWTACIDGASRARLSQVGLINKRSVHRKDYLERQDFLHAVNIFYFFPTNVKALWEKVLFHAWGAKATWRSLWHDR